MFIRIAIPVALLLIIGYGLTRAFPLYEGPSITLITPVAGDISTTGTVLVSGRAFRVQNLTLNGVPLIPDEKGSFSEELALPDGPVILSLRATDRFGRTITLERMVTVETTAPLATSTIATTTSKM